jgi:3,4-dihydroxy 2-butanone 4-phosphate synthase / GTP cyclohydrolase II
MSALSAAAERFAAGAPVLVGDEHDQAVFLATAADSVVPEQLARLQELGRGIVVLGLGDRVAERLCLATPRSAGPGLQLLTPIDATSGIDGGWSLRDRARTMRVAASAGSGPRDVSVPGHVFPARIGADGNDAASAAIELARISGHTAAVAMCAVLDRTGAVAGLRAVRGERKLARLPVASSSELHSHAVHRRADELDATCDLPTRDGRFRAIGFASALDEPPTIALVHGDPAAALRPLVHLHVACRFGDAFGSLLCDCRAQLDAAISTIVSEGCGVIIYAQASRLGPMVCTREQPIDTAVAVGLLRATGVRAARLTRRARELSGELVAHGLEVAA